jgi:hypothetical protein
MIIEDDVCFECGDPALFYHHVVPKSLGGNRTIPLCDLCHSKIHDLDMTKHRTLVLAAMKKCKERGVLLGAKNSKCRNLTAEAAIIGRAKGSANRKKKSQNHWSFLRPILEEMIQKGIGSTFIAHKLNDMGYRTQRGSMWNKTYVVKVLKILELWQSYCNRGKNASVVEEL